VQITKPLWYELNLYADSKRKGYAPFIVKAIDNNNFGECSGAHFCGTDQVPSPVENLNLYATH
jgi:hypothetical protein